MSATGLAVIFEKDAANENAGVGSVGMNGIVWFDSSLGGPVRLVIKGLFISRRSVGMRKTHHES